MIVVWHFEHSNYTLPGKNMTPTKKGKATTQHTCEKQGQSIIRARRYVKLHKLGGKNPTTVQCTHLLLLILKISKSVLVGGLSKV